MIGCRGQTHIVRLISNCCGPKKLKLPTNVNSLLSTATSIGYFKNVPAVETAGERLTADMK